MSEMDLEDLFVLYRTDALDSAERTEAEELLASGDERAHRALAQADLLLGMLPEALTPVIPPPQIEQALIARAEASIAPPISLMPKARIKRWAGPLALAAGLSLIVTSSLMWVQRAQRESDFRQELAVLTIEAEEERHRADSIAQRLAALEMQATASEQGRVESEQALAIQTERAEALALQLAEEVGSRREAQELPNPSTRNDAESLRLRVAELEETLEAEAEQFEEQLSESAKERLALSETLARSREALSLVRAPDVGIVDLVSADANSASSASVFWDRALKHCYLHVRALPNIEADERYALWLEYEGGQMHRVADFRVDRRGDAEFYKPLPSDRGQIQRTFITREPGAEKTQPSNQIVLSQLTGPDHSNQGNGSRLRRYRRHTL